MLKRLKKEYGTTGTANGNGVGEASKTTKPKQSDGDDEPLVPATPKTKAEKQAEKEARIKERTDAQAKKEAERVAREEARAQAAAEKAAKVF